MPLPRAVRVPPLGDGLWPRRLLSLAVAVVVAGLVGGGLWRTQRWDAGNLAGVAWALTGVQWLVGRWRPAARGGLAWTARVVGRDAVEPGLVARRSIAGWVDLVVDALFGVTATLAVAALLPEERPWGRITWTVGWAGIAVAVGRIGYEEARFTGRLALTAGGVRHGRRVYDWTNIDRVSPHRSDGRVDGVRLRPVRWTSLQQAPVVGGRDTAVPEDRLAAAIEYLRHRPQALATGLPVTPPEPAVPTAERLTGERPTGG
ncbi:hypothetical protein [Micromonospora mirobrigensis]|uniref:PH domain-containing protein n=1 Tax=Micromonospora mirobrigensis TaxID=262898 RepID=A0A1C4UYS8_9ACTN|nr:hypothetical protein [Micromonospora mirobrigensis]SCE76853.1 hypothetical protein GA0070564_101821 [Micromonospora mirobrigensis]